MEINKITAAGISDFQELGLKIGEKKANYEETKNENSAGKKEKQVNIQEVKVAVDKANKVLFKNNTHLQFRIHEKTNEVMVKIINDETGDVVKEIPPEKMLDMVAKLWEIAGIILDEKR